MRSRPVAPRASRTALITASVPELTARTLSIPGTRAQSRSANSTSFSVTMPNVVPFAACADTASTISGWA